MNYLKNINCKKIVTIHDLIHEKYYPEKKLANEEKKINCINQADFFICVSKNTQKDLIEHYKVDEKKLK